MSSISSELRLTSLKKLLQRSSYEGYQDEKKEIRGRIVYQSNVHDSMLMLVNDNLVAKDKPNYPKKLVCVVCEALRMLTK